MPRQHVPARDRIERHFSEGREDHCWEWRGTRDRNGYGVISERLGGKTKQHKAHRLVYERYCGALSPDLMIDHQCHNTACVNPGHLLPVTAKGNGENRLPDKRGRSSARGVSWHSGRQRWRVYVYHMGTRHFGGEYALESQAAQAARDLRNSMYFNNVLDR